MDIRRYGTLLCALALTGCGASTSPTETKADQAAAVCDTSDDLPFPSPEWSAREAANFARISEAPSRQAQDPAFAQRWSEQTVANRIEYENRRFADPNWSSGENACASWTTACATP